MQIMTARYRWLEASIAGYDRTGVPLVAEVKDEFLAAGYSDNVGIFYAIPWIVRTFGVSLDRAIDLLFYGVLYTGFACSALGLLVLFKTTTQRMIALAQLGFLFWFAMQRISDVYVFGVSVTVALLPWALWLLGRDHRKWLTLAFCVFAGICVAATYYFRVHAATAVAVFMLLLLLTDTSRSRLNRAVLALGLLAGAAGPVFWFGHLIHRRDAFLEEHHPEYYARSKSAFGVCAPWHSIYIGFGFLNNSHGIRYKDEVAIEKVETVSPGTVYLASDYQTVLRNELTGLVKRDYPFLIRTVAAKCGVLLHWFIYFANVGFLAAWLCPEFRKVNYALAAAALVAAVPGVLVMPFPHYVSCLLAVGMFFGAVNLNGSLANGALRRLPSEILRILRQSSSEPKPGDPTADDSLIPPATTRKVA